MQPSETPGDVAGSVRSPVSNYAAASPGTAKPSILEWLFVLLAVAIALWIFVTTVNISRAGWIAIPAADDWERWTTYLSDHYSPGWFFREHVDHRLAAPKILFAIDHLVFHARGWFLLSCSLAFQALTGLLLWRLSGHAGRQSLTERIVQASALAAFVFSGQQWLNFIRPFQVQFPMVYCAAAAAFFALWKATEPSADSKHGVRWIAVTIAMATLATYSMANGVLVWPVLLAAAVWLRLPRRSIGALAAGLVLIGATYFYHWHTSSEPGYRMTASERIPRLLVFWLGHLGSPVFPLAALRESEAFRISVAASVGGVLALALLGSFVLLVRRREQTPSAQTLLMFYGVFLAGTSATIAYGRSGWSMMDLYSPRYLTPSNLFWATMLLVCWPVLRRLNHTVLYGGLSVAMLAGIAMYQDAGLGISRYWTNICRLGEIGIVDNVIDPDPWRIIYHTPAVTLNVIDYLKRNNLSIYTEEWTHWPGIQLSSRFSIDGDSHACQGEFAFAAAVQSIKPGWRATGWAWDNKAERAPLYIVLADDKGNISGIGLSGFPPTPALSAIAAQHANSTWNGYIDGQERSISAYVIETDNHSLCPIGTQQLRNELAITELGVPFPDAPVEIAGGWAKDSYWKGANGPGTPPVAGAVFGSYPDAATGTIRLGPFHLDGHTGMGLPLVTGPDTHNLSVTVRDAATKVVLAQLDPLPMRGSWWAWRPSLPQGREIDIEVVAEDKGAGWGQWQALGWPHKLK